MKLSRACQIITFTIACIPFFHSCSKSEQITTELSGTVQIEITDAPVDNAEVVGSNITISAIYMGSDSNIMQQKHTVDLLAYQSGNTKILGDFSVAAATYDHIKIDLSLQEDAFGNTPGCYITTVDGKKHNLYPSTNLFTTLTLPVNSLKINPSEKTIVLLDFDLRKMIKSGDQNQIKYQFVEDRRLESSIRVLCKEKTGMIKGDFATEQSTENKVLVFVYRENSYNQSREVNSYSTQKLHFPEAVNSTALKENGSFILPFLERGTYELIFAAYDATDGNTLLGILEASGSNGTDLQRVNVESGNETLLKGKILGLKPI